MAHAKKKNPRRLPRSQADVDSAFQDGATLTLDLMPFTLGTDMEMSDEWLETFHERYMAHLRALKAGYITQEDLRETTLIEKGWKLELI